jgi:hypothetical protein
MLNLGDKAKDRITGLVGIVTGRAEYLYGCVQVLISPAEVKDGSPVPGTWLDEDRCDLVKAAVQPRPASAPVRTGGPVQNLPRVR